MDEATAMDDSQVVEEPISSESEEEEEEGNFLVDGN